MDYAYGIVVALIVVVSIIVAIIEYRKSRKRLYSVNYALREAISVFLTSIGVLLMFLGFCIIVFAGFAYLFFNYR